MSRRRAIRHTTRARRPTPRWLVAGVSLALLLGVGAWAQVVNRRSAEESVAAETTAAVSQDDTSTSASGAGGTTTSVDHDVTCTYPVESATTAEELQGAVWEAVQDRSAGVAVSVYDARTSVTCEYQGGVQFDAGTVVRATTLAAGLYAAQSEDRLFDSEEKDWAERSITQDDDEAQDALWEHVGTEGLQTFLQAAGMTQTSVGADDAWDITQVTAHDQMALMRVLTTGDLLEEGKREYAQGLLESAAASSVWGVPQGAPDGATVGALYGTDHDDATGWSVHSVGFVDDGGHRYFVAVLSGTNSTQAAGRKRLAQVSRAIHGVLS